MDFASLMKSQISADKPSDSGNKKYLKRSELEAQRQADYQREQEELEKAREERVEKKRKREEEEAERTRAREEKKRRLAEESRKIAAEEAEAEERQRRKRLGLPELEKVEENEDTRIDGEEDIPEDELLEKLKELNEPRILFGETHVQRLQRYRKLTAKTLTTIRRSDGPIPTTLEPVPAGELIVPATVLTDPENHLYLRRQLASYLNLLLSEWAVALSQRPKEVKESFSGKAAATHHTTAVSNLRPLVRKLETNTLSPSLLSPITNIVHLIQGRRYVDANDAYLRLSIGKAAWPIGVTMVGIHERSAREKLHEKEKGEDEAHILSDEETRKMLQGLKRGLTFAQTRWPPSDIGQLMG